MNYLWLILGWLAYFTTHSVLAGEKIKSGAQKVMGTGFKYYRFIYSTISTVGLIVLLFYGATIPANYFMERTEILRYISLMFSTFGVMTIRLAFKQFGFKSFIGVSGESQAFRRDGILNRVRHPIISGVILITVGYFLFLPNMPSLISSMCIFLYLPIGLRLEESKLIEAFGDEYRNYKKEVPAIFPRLF